MGLEESIKSAMTDLIQGTYVQIGTSIGEMMTSGDIGKSFEGFANGIMNLVGKFLVKIGEALIAFGTASKAFKVAISNPWAAIGAGIMLVAIGSALSNAASAGPGGSSSGGGGGSSSYSSTAYKSSVTQGDNRVVFEIQSSKLVGVLSNYDRKNQNIK